MFINFGTFLKKLTMENIADIRKDYIKHALSKDSTLANPIDQFQIWFDEALNADVAEVNAMVLSTVSKSNRPSSRIMLLKGVENRQFVFYTNYQSSKGQDMENNPFVSLNFFWAELERQVRIEGRISKVTEKISTDYFQSRPRGSQIGAHASPQSTPIADRTILEERAAHLKDKFGDEPIKKPAQWGGYSLEADQIGRAHV